MSCDKSSISSGRSVPFAAKLNPMEHEAERQLPWHPVDPLAAVLHGLRMTGAFYCSSELTAPWGFELPPFPGCLAFHVVVEGECLLKLPGGETLVLGPGDFALLTQGQGHFGLSDPHVTHTPRADLAPQEYVGDHFSILNYGGGGELTRLVCGVVSFEHPAASEFVALLPPIIHLPARGGPGSHRLRQSIDLTLELMKGEASNHSAGGEAVLTRLADILVIQALRVWLESPVENGSEQPSWLLALRDPQMGGAIAAVVRDPAHPWSVASLAREAAMSRSAFAARFTQLAGEPVMRYVTRWRMNLAAAWLREGRVQSVSELPELLGYSSEPAFNRAFKSVVGVPPGSLRKAS